MKNIWSAIAWSWRYHLELWLGGLAVIAVTCIVLATAVGVRREEGERRAFMVDCLRERKQYECTAIWRWRLHP